MAITTLLDPATKQRGSLRNLGGGGVTLWDAPHAANVLRHLCRQRPSRTVAQVPIRANLQTRAYGFQALAPALRAAWNAAAVSYTRTNTAGVVYTLTGTNLWAMCNFHRAAAGVATTNAPPTNTTTPTPLNAGATGGSPDSFTITKALADVGWFLIAATDFWTNPATLPMPTHFTSHAAAPGDQYAACIAGRPAATSPYTYPPYGAPLPTVHLRITALSPDFIPNLTPFDFTVTMP